MNHAIKLGRFTSQSSFFTSSSSSLSSIQSTSSKGSGRVRFVNVSSGSDRPKQPDFGNMDVKKDDQKYNKNGMEESFGAGYATRSDEEGFGGVYGVNYEDNAEMKIVQDPAHHDSSQGSEVKEKEVSRHQTKEHGDRN